MPEILDSIVDDKKREVARARRKVPLSVLMERIGNRPAPLDFAAALRGDKIKLIAEVKKASPSRGLLRPDFDPVALAKTYARYGAAAVSVLTEVNYFQGSLEHLAAVKEAVDIPVLRKDFIFDEYQVYESAAHGADALLLITAILDPPEMAKLLALSRSLGMRCLVEVHNEDELMMALLAGAGIIGINNRNLHTFKVDTNTTRRLRLLVPRENIVVSESGIKNAADMKMMKECKVNAVLVGEALVTAPDIPAKIKELMS
ncbi:MAG: indole-3-glycerol phosphate synthase TrpC [Chloroflexota bacterium]